MESQSEISPSLLEAAATVEGQTLRKKQQAPVLNRRCEGILFVLHKFLCSEAREIIGGKLCGKASSTYIVCFKIIVHI
jgi:hypothetical protein